MKVVSNSTPLIALSRINELDLLHKIFGTIIIPSAVHREVVLQGTGRPGVERIIEASWIITNQVENQFAVSMLAADLDQGEAEAVVLSKELEVDYFLVDEKKARRVARSSQIRIIGTVGVLGLASKKGLVSNLDEAFRKLEQNGFRFTEAVKEKVKQQQN